ncbi:MAG: sigma-70 family RNA polymerase sigma factor [Spirochaetes bacterium]|jgi:RNA polymerase sigma-70 factor (ECF subfamily)|nr:sigma-70 family RNA polymerase sigma factor [Spirochaetota bacterium]
MSDNSARDQEDLAVVRSVLDGDRNAFRRLVEKYQPAVAAIGRRSVGVREDLKDFVQDVFLKAFTHLGQFSGKGRFYSWLMRIAYTTAINRSQRKSPEVPTDPELLSRLWHASREREPDRATERTVLWESIVAAISELPGQLALSVELFFVMGLRYREIAEMTGVPVNTLKSHIRRARRLLQERLDQSMLEDHDDL